MLFLPFLLSSFFPLLAAPAVAQASLAEELRAQRLRLRAAEVMTEIGTRAAPRPAAVLTPDSLHDPRRAFWWLRRSEAPAIAHGPLPPPEPEPEPEAPPARLEAIRFGKVGPHDQEAFLNRFREALWTNEGMRFSTPLDTIPTPELRARLNNLYGAPTRSPLARAEVGYAGSAFVQFEYWFVVNDSIPFVVMDVDGPFERGLVFAGDLEHAAVLGQIKRFFAERLATATRRMPYVDYYQSQDRDQWYRTGFDGETFYTVEIRRPRWARRSTGTESWYEFR